MRVGGCGVGEVEEGEVTEQGDREMGHQRVWVKGRWDHGKLGPEREGLNSIE